MSESSAQRTLVKSPPELWAEVSDADALTRHLGALGEIRITRVEPETIVAWEGESVRGTVALKPSGWGTKVTLTAETVELEPEPVPEPEAVVEPEREPAVEPVAEVESEPEPVAEVEPEPVLEPEPVAQTQRRGFWARLFGWRQPEAVAAPEPEAVVEPEPAPEPEPDPEPVLEAEPEPEAIAAPEVEPEVIVPAASPRLSPQELEGALVAALDDLGSAHHRPFSRS